VSFEIHQMVLNPTGKLLAVAGAFQVAVIVLPRPGFMRLVSETIDCKYGLLLFVVVVSLFIIPVGLYKLASFIMHLKIPPLSPKLTGIHGAKRHQHCLS
jgi:hypothetical protein